MFQGKIPDGRHTRPWNKNRHTKPCKFYQTMSCPLSADVCDFTHVLVDPPPPIGIDAPAICRYYQAGFCANGAWCKYAHALEASPALSSAMMKVSNRNGPRRRSSSNPVPRQYVPTDHGVISMHTPVAVNVGPVLGPPPPTPVNLSSPPPSNSFPTLPHHSGTMASSSIPDLLDDVYASTEDPQMSEHSHLHQSRIHIADPSPIVHVPPYPNPLLIGPISPQYHFAPQLYMLQPKIFRLPAPPKKHKARGISKKKLERYKTKPCKFFCTTGMCPNGDSCTFIHDEDPRSIKRASLSKNKADDMEPNSFDASSEFAKLSLDQMNKQDFRRVRALSISTREDESLSHDSSNSSENDSSESDNPASTKKKTKRRTRANSIPSRPTASGQLNMDNLFPAESPAVL